MTLRLVSLALLLGGEVLLASLAFDGATLDRAATGGLALLRDYGAWTLRWTVASTLVFLSLAVMRGQMPLASGSWPNLRCLALHLPAAFGFFGLTRAIYANALPGNWSVALWLALAAATAFTAALAFLSRATWVQWLRLTGPLWWMSALAGASACALGAAGRLLWKPATLTTFALVKFMLGFFTDQMILQPERVRLGTPNFMVIISPECSGLEGMGLFLVFGLLWLIVFRDQLRFPQALLLIPLGAGVSYLLNAVRIFALLLIGHFGFRDIAVRGFHSQAGWIAFCLVAGGLLWISLRLPWFAKHAVPRRHDAYPAMPYLAPFMALMAAGILSQALTAHFEWFYPLRLAATVAVLIAFRAYYTQLDWRFGPWAVFTGVAVFALWVSAADTAPSGPPPELAAADPTNVPVLPATSRGRQRLGSGQGRTRICASYLQQLSQTRSERCASIDRRYSFPRLA